MSAKDSIDIETRDFTNTSGRLQTHGDVRIKTDGQFRNTGGGTLQKNVPQTLTYYTWSGSGSPVAHTQTIYRDVYHPDLGKAGVITVGRYLDITAGRFDNSFGILNAAQRMGIRSLAELCNECGLIYSSGPTFLVGTLLRNGYMRGAETVRGVDPNAPIKESRVVQYQQWVQSGYETSRGGLAGMFGGTKWVDTSHNETRHRTDVVTTGYGARTQSVSASQYPGYIFSDGDLDVQMGTDAYLGTIVSGGNVRIKGATQGSINSADRGLLVVRGDVTAELRKAALHQLSIQAQNIYFQLIDDLVIRGIVKPVVLPDGSAAQIIDLQRLGRQMGFLMDGATFAEQGSTLRTPTGFVPMGLQMSGSGPLGSPLSSFSVHPTASSGFMGSTPTSRFFMPTVQDRILNQLITMTLAPLHGRDMLLTIDLAGQLRRSGARMAGAFRGMHTITLPDGNPAMLFDKSNNPDVEIEVDGETMMVPLYNPYLICDAVSRLINTIHAEELVSMKSLGDIRLEPGQIDIQSQDLSLESQQQVQIAAEFKYDPNTGNRVGVDPVKLSVPGTLTLSGKTGVKTKGFHPSARTMHMTSSDGSVVDMDMPLDPTFTFLGGGRVTMQQQTATSAFRTSDGMSFSAPMGTIDQHGTDMFAGPGGILFDAQKHTWQPAFEESGYFHSHRKGYVRMHSRTPKVGTMQTPGSVIFRSKDTTLMGAQIIAGTISNPVDGTLRTAPVYSSHQSHSFTTKSGFLGLGHSSVEIEETRELVEPTRMFADHFESLGIGTYEMESTVVRALDATITKNLVERTAYDKIHTKVTQKSSGFFAPKIKGDPFVESLHGVRNVVTFSGDTLPTAFNIVGTGAQTLAHATTLANLSTNPSPITAVAQIFLSRFMTGAVYSNIKTVTTRDESRPSQSKVDVGVLRVTNDRTHLEGVWNVTGRGEIRTGEFTTSAPKHTVTQTQETTGWSVSISPAALLGAAINPCALTALGCLPNVSVQQSDGTFFQKSHTPAILRADDLFIRAGNAVFSGSKIHARLMEAIIDGSLTIETLTDEFRSESSSSAIGGSLAAIGGMLNDVKPDPLVSNPRLFADPRLGAIPTMRFADEESMSQKIQEVAQMVGTEQFYLTVGNLLHKKGAMVGLKPDGVVTRNDAERIQAGRVLEEQVREAETHKRSVFNPAIGEFVAMMGQIDELQQVRARIAAELAAQKMRPEEEKQANREANEFIEKQEVKEDYEKLKQAQAKQQQAKKTLARLDAEDPELRAKLAGMPPSSTAKPKAEGSSRSQSTSKLTAKSSDASTSRGEGAEMARLFEYKQAQEAQSSAAREAFTITTSIREKAQAFAAEHPTFAKWGGYVLQGIGSAAIAGALISAAEVGLAAFLTTGASMVATDQAMAAIIENGTESFVEYAASQGKTEAEARKFADTAIWTVEMIVTGAATIGLTKLIKNGGAVMARMQTLKGNTASLANRIFQRTQVSKASVDVAISREMFNAALTSPVVSSKIQRLATPSQLDFFCLRGYAREMEGVSGLPIAGQQRSRLFGALREKNYVKLEGMELRVHKGQYNSAIKDVLITEWEANTGQKWPTYEKLNPLTGATEVKRYQFHHVIPQQYGGPHAWWNGHPLHPDFHQGGIHGKNSILTGILQSLGE